MRELVLLLDRLSVALQFAVVMCLAGYFLLLGFMVSLREVRLWMWAWLFDAAALAGIFIHVYAHMPLFGHRIALVAYLVGKTAFAILIFSGARHHLRPGAHALAKPTTVTAFIAAWSLAIGLAVPFLWHARLAQSSLGALVFLAGGFTVLRNPRSRVSRWLGAAMCLQGTTLLFSALLMLPGLWGNASGFDFLVYWTFIDAGAELLLALACLAVIADRREQQLNYLNHELMESQQRLRELVDTDPLTSLANRRTLRTAMDEVSAAGGVVIFIDINRLRSVNDLFGHRVGDRALQRLAALLPETFRPQDRVIRWGGDEFLVAAPGMSTADAHARVAALRTALRQAGTEVPELTIAVGVAEIAPGGDAAAVLDTADRLMAADKNGPRRP